MTSLKREFRGIRKRRACIEQNYLTVTPLFFMVEKVQGRPKINKLLGVRVIHLYEADYNLLLKINWARRLI
jgi:hypothetical protein